MANKNKKTYVDITTPFGKFNYPRLNTPDTKYKAKGEYRVDLLLSAEDAVKLGTAVDDLVPEAKQMCADRHENRGKLVADRLCLSPQLNKDTKQPTGLWVFRAKTSAMREIGGTEQEVSLPVFNSQRRPVTDIIGSGTVGRLSATLAPYARPSSEDPDRVLYGVTAYLNGVQIKTLCAPGSNPDMMGFDEIEDELAQDEFDVTLSSGDPTTSGADY